MNGFPLISALTLVPFAGGVILLALGSLLPRRNGRPYPATWPKATALAFSLLGLALVVLMWARFDTSATVLQFQERFDWIPSLAVQYRVAVDGLGLLMLTLSALVVPMALLASRPAAGDEALHCGLVLLLQAGLFGTFTALNFFHWFLFWELSLVPAFFLIRLGGGPGSARAAMQFFVYTMAGSVALLLAFMALFLATGKFDFIELAGMAREGTLLPALSAQLGSPNTTAESVGLLVFAGAFLGFAVKVPAIPFHTWLPGTYAEAPSSVTMLLTGLMSKMGVYGFIRILLPIFPDSARALAAPLLVLAVATIVLSAGAALAQNNLKRMLAYSSINHLGYCLLGLFAILPLNTTALAPAVERSAALSGVFLQMFNHGLTAATLFWFVSLLEERTGGLTELHRFGGLRAPAPVFCGLMGVALFSSLGLPGLNGFVGEFLIFKGAFPLAPWAAAFSLFGLLFTALFILKILQQVFHGPLNPDRAGFPDLTARERAVLAVPAGLMVLLGVYPQLLLEILNRTTAGLAAALGS